MQKLVGLIPAAGRGVRAYPYTGTIPKSMLEVDGLPVLQRNVEIMRDQLAIEDVRIVVGHRSEVIRNYFGDGARLGVRIAYVLNDRLDLELPYSVYLASRGLDTPVCMILADECYVGSNHAGLLATPLQSALFICTLIASDSPKHIRKNYTVTLDGDRILDMHEKPSRPTERYMGTGTYLMSAELLRRLADRYQRGAPPRDWTSWLAEQCRAGAVVRPYWLTGRYVNINTRDDLNFANYLVRDLHFNDKTTSMVFVVPEHEDGAAEAMEALASRPEIHEVVAVVRRATPALEAVARNPKIRVTVESDPDAGVGDLVRFGLATARGSVLLISYHDGTFSPRDVTKFLAYLRDADMVLGTRTTRQMIEQGSNMRGLVRMTHILLARLLGLLWWRFDCRFTDVCGMHRGMWRSTFETIRDPLKERGVEIFPEMVIEVLRARRRVIEIPINYYNRDPLHPFVWSRYQTAGTFFRVVGLMLRKRLRRPNIS